MRISDWSSDVCSSDLGGRQRLLPFLPLRLLPAVLTPAVEIGLDLLLALPAVFVIVAVQLLDLPVAPAAIMAVLALIGACVVVLMSKPRTRPGLAAGERPAALVPLHSGRIAEYGVLAAPLVALGVALPLFVPFVCHRPSARTSVV